MRQHPSYLAALGIGVVVGIAQPGFGQFAPPPAPVGQPNDDLAEAQRQVREGEERISRQLALIRRLDAAGRREDARAARELLGTITDTVNVARRHLTTQRRYPR